MRVYTEEAVVVDVRVYLVVAEHSRNQVEKEQHESGGDGYGEAVVEDMRVYTVVVGGYGGDGRREGEGYGSGEVKDVSGYGGGEDGYSRGGGVGYGESRRREGGDTEVVDTTVEVVVWWRWLLEGGGGGLCHGGGCRGDGCGGDGCRSGGCGGGGCFGGGCRYGGGRREGGTVVVEVAIGEEEVVVNTVEIDEVVPSLGVWTREVWTWVWTEELEMTIVDRRCMYMDACHVHLGAMGTKWG
ncbi:hypothetical protein DY000_02046316 [Brassica cretica]|uniref:Uncharacterized protein n=1 Tax=Brassica cretica TaxID=69181 RepID=A0ABQ7EW10_BRACR|nr:hypothetical protein DY000_02046316 [Brassica cretica]